MINPIQSQMTSIIKNAQYFLYTSSNDFLFHINFLFWFSIKLFLSFEYGFNIYLVLYGFLLWPFWEYIYHRFIMHGLKNTPYYYKLHGYHHTYPNKMSHIPIFQYIIVSPSFFILSYYTNPSYIFSYSVGHLSGLFCFEKIHSFIHNDVKKEKIYTEYHLYHHKSSNNSYCFTCPCFDILFNTFPHKEFEYNLLAILPIPYIGFYGVSKYKGSREL
jgi:hypothetical protein